MTGHLRCHSGPFLATKEDSSSPIVFVFVLSQHQAHSEDDYASLLRLSYSFYQGQMSGALPAWNKLLYSLPGGYKKNSHLTDGSSISKDLSGGFYDAGGELCQL